MKKLEKVILVEFFLYNAEEIEMSGSTAFLGPNGTGKSAILDAFQIVMLGADRRHLKFNSKKQAGGEDKRTMRGYCLGAYTEGLARTASNTYITLIFRDEATKEPISIGVALRATESDNEDILQGLYVVDGEALTLGDHIEDVGNGDIASRPWNDFKSTIDSLRKRSNVKSVTSTDRNEQFLRSVLHALQAGNRAIDLTEYVKAFKKSLALANITSASDFVRDVLVGEEKVNRSRAREHITGFKALKALIEEIKAKIDGLGTISKFYHQADRALSFEATWKGLAATYEYEVAVSRHDDAKKEHQHQRVVHADAQRTLAESSDARRFALQNRDNAARMLNENTVESEWRARNAELNMVKAAYDGKLIPLDTAARSLRRAVSNLLSLACAESAQREIALSLNGLDMLSQTLKAKDYDQAIDAVTATFALLSEMETPVRNSLGKAEAARQLAEDALQAERGKQASMQSGGKDVPNDVARSLDFLLNRGFDAVPICNLVRVTEAEWQPSIEAFLQSNRFAFIVRDRATEALRTMRHEGRSLSFTKIVQPPANDYYWNAADRDLVGNLLAGDPLALVALRLKLGSLRKVETEDDLMRFKRSLSKDAWASAGGMVERLQQPEFGLFLGEEARKTVSTSQASKVLEAERSLRDAKMMVDHHTRFVNDYARQLEDMDMEVFLALIASIQTAERLAGSEQAKLDAIDVTSIERLREAAHAADDEFNRLDKRHEAAVSAEATAGNEVIKAESAARLRENEMVAAHTRQDAARNVPGFDPQEADMKRNSIEMLFGGSYEAIEALIKKCLSNAESEGRKAIDRMKEGDNHFKNFIEKYGDSFHEDRSDFRRNKQQIDELKASLEDSDLQRKENEAAAALAAAEEAFRRDIALKVRDAIERMSANCGEMNRILSKSPAFSNGERYKFVYEVVPDCQLIYNYIMDARNDDAGPGLFSSGDSATQEAVLKLIEESADPKAERTINPLEDFRLLFTYDLAIFRGDKKVGTLGKRMGTGSNGEHLTPFYVVIGATLAHAYRLDPRTPGAGFGVIIIDEAFAAIDETNALAAARFLRGLGLQLLMAGPNDSLNKLVPFTDIYYEMHRASDVLTYEKKVLKDGAQRLMSSDMPSEHPQLIEQLVQQLHREREAMNARHNATAA
ncbi:MAG: AAA family ATPase [Nevskia sp.]|jgi:energy-coupling factor transporter ATP-binding protein EcfA2|nr:AAA family ATPase [Nevskia sp.]MCK9383035.1 AAA family ATPase [Nevskia sp.]